LRQDYERFRSIGARVVAVAPDSESGVAKFVRDNAFPFPILADPDHTAFDAYDVVAKMMSLGQRPAVFVIDREGVVRFDSIGTQQWQIPSDDAVLAVVSALA
jgi:peroxiredoxin Q/BCP